MQRRQHGVLSLCAVIVLLGAVACASTKVTERQILVNEKIPRPDHIWVHDFVATRGDIPPESSLLGGLSEHSTPQTEEQIAYGRQVGADVAGYLVQDIQAMGMPAVLASSGGTPQINDIVIDGYLLSVVKGSAMERVVVGFGAGASELTAAVEGFQVTEHGLRKLGSGDVSAGGAKGPGVAVPAAIAIASSNPIGLAVSGAYKVYGEESGRSTLEGREKSAAQEIAAQIKVRMEAQGWID